MALNMMLKQICQETYTKGSAAATIVRNTLLHCTATLTIATHCDSSIPLVWSVPVSSNVPQAPCAKAGVLPACIG